ncbi:hypothetical protein HF521_015966, partial [Silurus meridionalis]
MGESCTLFTTNGWYDVNCDVNHPVICQRRFILVNEKKKWDEALQHCRNCYTELTVESAKQLDQLKLDNKQAQTASVWTGLREEFSYTNWFPGEPNDCNGKESCTAAFQNCWNDMDCETYFPFMCQRRFILVEEKKTWDEALQHCRNHNSNLTVMRFETLADPLKIKTEQAQTASMWTGLRFLDGKWYRENGVEMENLISLPPCPVQPYSCGAYNLNTYAWENRDCNEELNFLC